MVPASQSGLVTLGAGEDHRLAVAPVKTKADTCTALLVRLMESPVRSYRCLDRLSPLTPPSERDGIKGPQRRVPVPNQHPHSFNQLKMSSTDFEQDEKAAIRDEHLYTDEEYRKVRWKADL